MNKNKLLDAYLDLMGHLYEAMDDTLHSFADALTAVQHKMLHNGSTLTHEEFATVAQFVRRDIERAAHDLAHQADHNSLSEWFKFDVALVENFALDAFLGLADKTRVELAKLQLLAEKHVYHSGDITSPGTFICDACGKEIAFKTASEIPTCPACQANTFVRL
jgi:site-specific recombinase XerD